MKPNELNTQERLSLDGGGPRLLVRPESFAEFDLSISHDLACVEQRWSHYAMPRADREFFRPKQPR